ncbi:unnamed protein product [Allacma fusca]|uniref:Uncharacterized protein n=1 Tax=Allacma fusca TaxID=39272 RepID=A0A8J2NZZ6_9HEXA|nr:unnamed protein product [Allacma fusca]
MESKVDKSGASIEEIDVGLALKQVGLKFQHGVLLSLEILELSDVIVHGLIWIIVKGTGVLWEYLNGFSWGSARSSSFLR